jgi:hypothetical protein
MDEHNIDFWKLFCRIARVNNITPREIKYLLWRFYNCKIDREIAKLDGHPKMTRKGINIVIMKAYRKIRQDKC